MMKKLFSSKTLTTGVLALFLAVVTMTSATAQTGNSSGSTTGSTTSGGYTDTRGTQRDEGYDWGWLGLLGLTGLLGLIPKKQRVETEYRTSNTAPGATSR